MKASDLLQHWWFVGVYWNLYKRLKKNRLNHFLLMFALPFWWYGWQKQHCNITCCIIVSAFQSYHQKSKWPYILGAYSHQLIWAKIQLALIFTNNINLEIGISHNIDHRLHPPPLKLDNFEGFINMKADVLVGVEMTQHHHASDLHYKVLM